MHVAGSQNTTADILSRLEFSPKEKVELKLREDILTSPIEVNLHSTDVAFEENIFFLPAEEEESEHEIFAIGKHYNVVWTKMKKNCQSKQPK